MRQRPVPIARSCTPPPARNAALPSSSLASAALSLSQINGKVDRIAGVVAHEQRQSARAPAAPVQPVQAAGESRCALRREGADWAQLRVFLYQQRFFLMLLKEGAGIC